MGHDQGPGDTEGSGAAVREGNTGVQAGSWGSLGSSCEGHGPHLFIRDALDYWNQTCASLFSRVGHRTHGFCIPGTRSSCWSRHALRRDSEGAVVVTGRGRCWVWEVTGEVALLPNQPQHMPCKLRRQCQAAEGRGSAPSLFIQEN